MLRDLNDRIKPHRVSGVTGILQRKNAQVLDTHGQLVSLQTKVCSVRQSRMGDLFASEVAVHRPSFSFASHIRLHKATKAVCRPMDPVLLPFALYVISRYFGPTCQDT